MRLEEIRAETSRRAARALATRTVKRPRQAAAPSARDLDMVARREQGQTWAVIGDKWGVSVERARQIVRRTLERTER